jgi:sulfide dehydrogenase [flavocytochrome c] flavoprotein subunit
MNMTRRDFLKSLALASGAALLSRSNTAFASARHVIVIGGGSGGATAARYLRLFDPSIQVTLIEPQKRYNSLLMSGEVLAGMRKPSSLQFDYLKLSQLGIKVINERVVSIDAEQRIVKTDRANSLPYDRCIVSPGIDFKWEEIAGYDEKIAEQRPHAWSSGAQLITLKQQLTSMHDGGTVIISIPQPPYRCPAAPYERASLMAHYLKQHKAKSKVIILDSNPTFNHQKEMTKYWQKNYQFATEKSVIERYSTEIVTELDAPNRTVMTKSGQQIKGDVINIIPPQKAGKIAVTSGLADKSGWCPVNLLTFESRLKNNIHVIGDAAIGGGVSKLASSANAQGKICAAAVVALLNGEAVKPLPLIETSYSIIGPTAALSSSTVFKQTKEGEQLKLITNRSNKTKRAKKNPLREFYNAHSWYNNISRDIFG